MHSTETFCISGPTIHVHVDIYVRVSGRNISDAYCMCTRIYYMYVILYIREMLSRALGFHNGGAIYKYTHIYIHISP